MQTETLRNTVLSFFLSPIEKFLKKKGHKRKKKRRKKDFFGFPLSFLSSSL
jgi:hypothetical protein